jgi:hypothetical protein
MKRRKKSIMKNYSFFSSSAGKKEHGRGNVYIYSSSFAACKISLLFSRTDDDDNHINDEAKRQCSDDAHPR